MSERGDAREILLGALRVADARAAVRQHLTLTGDRLQIEGQDLHLVRFRAVRLIAVGKAAASMTQGVLDVLGDRVESGIVVTKNRHVLAPLPDRIAVWEAGHPIPDSRSLAGAAETLRLARSAADDDLVICLLSGGASSLVAAPPADVSLSDLQRVTEELLRAGAPIQEINTVRKHLSRISGGRLARAIAPARLLTLAISDVVGGAADVIASGPTVPDPTTFEDALKVLDARAISVPLPVRAYLQRGAAGELPESPGAGEIEASGPYIVADNSVALAGAAEYARSLGYEVEVVTDRLEGEARLVGQAVVARACQAAANSDSAKPMALLWGGETTVTVKGSGTGGRNQELVLAAAIELAGVAGIVVGAFATDGTDGPGEAAGGVVNGETAGRGRDLGCDPEEYLRRNDSFNFLRSTGDLLLTGPTGTNVNDVVIALIDPPRPERAAQTLL